TSMRQARFRVRNNIQLYNTMAARMNADYHIVTTVRLNEQFRLRELNYVMSHQAFLENHNLQPNDPSEPVGGNQNHATKEPFQNMVQAAFKVLELMDENKDIIMTQGFYVSALENDLGV